MDTKENMVKLVDFARDNGVTDRAIQKHIQKHEADLLEHIDRQGNSGTWLDDFAQHYIRGLLLRQPLAVIKDNEDYRLLREENIELRTQIGKATDQILKLQDILTAQAMELADGRTAQKLLEAAESRQNALQAELERYRLDVDEAEESANKAALEAQKAQSRAEAAEAEAERLKNRGLWSRITNKV